MKKYYSMEQQGKVATIQIYGDITSWPYEDSDVSSFLLSKQIEALGDVDVINVYINSYGGEVAEGWAIYNALRRHPAKVHTYADGFVCSIASVIFEAGDKRTMMDPSALMVHQPSTWASGNADKLRKEAETLDTIGELSAKAYLRCVNISEDNLKQMLDVETWIIPEEAVRMGFATDIEESEESTQPSQNAKKQLVTLVTEKLKKENPPKNQSGFDIDQLYETFKQRLLKEMKKQPPESGVEQPQGNLMKFLNAL